MVSIASTLATRSESPSGSRIGRRSITFGISFVFFGISLGFFLYFLGIFGISLVFLVTRSEPPSGSRVGRGGLTAGLESSKTCHSPVAVGFACRQVTRLLSCRSCCPPLSCRLQCPAHAALALKKMRLCKLDFIFIAGRSDSLRHCSV